MKGTIFIMSKEYKSQVAASDMVKVIDLAKEMPPFFTDYINGSRNVLSPKTLLSYTIKIKSFMEYLHKNSPYFSKKEIKNFTLDDMDLLDKRDIEEYTAYLSTEKIPAKKGSQYRTQSTIENHMASLSALWTYFYNNDDIKNNPFLKIRRYHPPKDKTVIHLKADQKNKFLETAETGSGMTEKQKQYHLRNSVRDNLICTLLLNTGIRVSELVSLDIDDIDLEDCSLNIIRKRGKSDTVYFSDETKEQIKEYLEIRNFYQPTDDEHALFLVGIGKYKGTRLSVRSVESLVKKVANASGIINAHEITPHKLRSTYAMDMLKATGNLSLVKEQLGHENVATTQIYAKADKEAQKSARNIL